jgi:hypothetical protein
VNENEFKRELAQMLSFVAGFFAIMGTLAVLGDLAETQVPVALATSWVLVGAKTMRDNAPNQGLPDVDRFNLRAGVTAVCNALAWPAVKRS